MKCNLLLVQIVFILFFSCIDNDVSNKGKQIGIDFAQIESISFKEIFEEVDVIVPELNEYSSIKDITRVFFLDSMICIYDRSYLGHVFLFDMTGKHIRNIGIRGEGPEEYPDIADVKVYDKQSIWILSAMRNCLFVYNLDGKLEEIIPLPKYDRSYKSFSFLNKDSIAFWSADRYKLKFYSLSKKEIFHEEYEEGKRDIFCSYEFQIDKCLCRGMTNTIYSLEKGYLEPMYTWDFGDLTNNLSKLQYPDYNDGKEVRKFAEDAYSSKIVDYLLPFHGMNNRYIYTQAYRKNKPHNIFYNYLNDKVYCFEKTKEGASFYPICWDDIYVFGLVPKSIEDVIPEKIMNDNIKTKINGINEESNPIIVKYKLR